jgi:hypothetical protein
MRRKLHKGIATIAGEAFDEIWQMGLLPSKTRRLDLEHIKTSLCIPTPT